MMPGETSLSRSMRTTLRSCRCAGILAIAWIFAGLDLVAGTFKATLDRDTIVLGETATLTLVVDDGAPAETPAPPVVSGLSINYVGQQSQYNFVNGRGSSILSYTFLVRAAQSGEYTIPALSSMIDGKVLATQPLKLKVLKPSEAPVSEAPNKAAFLRLTTPKTNIYLGEVLPLDIQLYAQQGQLRAPPQVDQQGFTVGKLVQQQQTRTMLGNRYYSLLVYKSYVIPAKTGALTLGPASMPLSIPKPNSRVNLFGEPVDWMDVSLRSEPLIISVSPLPTNGVPPGFAGAIGNYQMEATVSTNVATVGDPITLGIRIIGRGPIESLAFNPADNWPGFKTYPPVTKVETSDEFGLQGIKSFEQVVIPENTQIKELPPIAFSFFDPDQNAYRTVTRPATPMTVRPGTIGPARPTVVADATLGPAAPAQPADIVHIKTRPGLLAEIKPPLIRQTWFVTLQCVPVLAWLVMLAGRRRAERLANNPRLRRRLEVARVIRAGLADLRRLAANHQAEDFFASVFRLLQEQLGERLNLPASAITEAVVEERLRPMQADPEIIQSIEELFLICNQARYAPQRSSQELASLIPKVETALGALRQLEAAN
jgi:hypothetical protein